MVERSPAQRVSTSVYLRSVCTEISYLRELTNYMPGLDPEDTAKR
jgi:hypothetical protein